MPTPADAPLRKVTINLYEEDVVLAETLYGHGWSQHLRLAWHTHLVNQRLTDAYRKRTLGDLTDG